MGAQQEKERLDSGEQFNPGQVPEVRLQSSLRKIPDATDAFTMRTFNTLRRQSAALSAANAEEQIFAKAAAAKREWEEAERKAAEQRAAEEAEKKRLAEAAAQEERERQAAEQAEEAARQAKLLADKQAAEKRAAQKRNMLTRMRRKREEKRAQDEAEAARQAKLLADKKAAEAKADAEQRRLQPLKWTHVGLDYCDCELECTCNSGCCSWFGKKPMHNPKNAKCDLVRPRGSWCNDCKSHIKGAGAPASARGRSKTKNPALARQLSPMRSSPRNDEMRNPKSDSAKISKARTRRLIERFARESTRCEQS